MAALNFPNDEMIYMAFNSIFKGQNSQIRKIPAIQRLVAKHQEQPQVAQLLEVYSAPVIYKKLQKLLGDKIFERTVKEKTEFPELFEVSPARVAERAISEAEAAGDHTKAVEEALASSDHCGNSYERDDNSGGTGTDPEAEESIESPTEPELAHLMATGVPSLFPLEFHFTTGHRILIKTQEVLELACFRFAEKAMPEILAKREWHCPESGELNKWTFEFTKRLEKFDQMASRAISPSRALKELFPSIAEIRHRAVHRIPVTAKELEQFMADGETLAQLFNDPTAVHVMSRARSEVRKAAAEMENTKNTLEARLSKILQDVVDKRAELDRIETAAIADMQRKDREYQSFAGALLEEAVWSEDAVTREGSLVVRRPAANGVDKNGVEDHVNTALESDIASHEDSKIDIVVEEAPNPWVGTLIHDSDGDIVLAKVGEAPTEEVLWDC